MRCIPVQRNVGAVRSVLAVLLLAGFVFYAIPAASGAAGVHVPAWPFTALSFACIIAAIFLFTRYRMTGFQYIIRPRSETDDSGLVTAQVSGMRLNIGDLPPETLDFAVVKSMGARPGAMECLLGLDSLVAVLPLRRNAKDGLTKAGLRDRYAADGYVWYDYTLTFGIDDALALVFLDGNRYAGIIIEPDEAMRAYFSELKPPRERRK